MNIMVVDDCATTRRLLGHYLKSRGYSVLFAENGFDALEKLGKHSVAIIMTDLNMPHMDGLELTKTVRSDPQWSGIPILMVSTENNSEEREKARQYGANGYVVKPVTGDVLAEQIKSLLNQFSCKGESR